MSATAGGAGGVEVFGSVRFRPPGTVSLRFLRRGRGPRCATAAANCEQLTDDLSRVHRRAPPRRVCCASLATMMMMMLAMMVAMAGIREGRPSARAVFVQKHEDCVTVPLDATRGEARRGRASRVIRRRV